MQNSNYNHHTIEKQIYDYWEKNNFFKPKKNKKKYFSVVIPPPNITGSLHMGHALNNSLQDLLVRFHRMNGYETLWQPGTDHAGIATQAVVEKELSLKGITKNQLGRNKFIEEVWKWKKESGDQILNQLKKLGCSCDWSRNRFTMDKDLSKAVIKTFVKLYQQKLVYKDTKLVNWDTKLETAISDLEVEQKEVQSNLYYIKYKVVGENNQIIIATTRPETMLGDTAVAVNPKDDRYKNFVGKKILIPIVDREVKIISDNFVAIDQGSGALKITPAHDFNDFDIGKRHNLKFINIFEKNGRLNNKVPNELVGLDRFEARKLIVKKLKEKDLLEKIENIKNVVPYGDRSNTIIEPLLTEQWFADAKFLAKKAIDVVKKKKTNFFPNNSLWRFSLSSDSLRLARAVSISDWEDLISVSYLVFCNRRAVSAFFSFADELANSVRALATLRFSSDLSNFRRSAPFFTWSPSSKGKDKTSPLALDLTSTLKFGSTMPVAEILINRSPCSISEVLNTGFWGSSEPLEGNK